jgi:preprotein translocase subunit SecE
VADPDQLSNEPEGYHGGAQIVEHHTSPGARLVGFLRGSFRELQRVQWPDRRQVMQATGVVLGFVIVAGVFLGIADLVASKLVHLILQ